MKKLYIGMLTIVGTLALAGCKPGPITLGHHNQDQAQTQGNDKQAVSGTKTTSTKNQPVSNSAAAAVEKKGKIALDADTQEKINQAVANTLQTRQTTSWQSKTASGTVVPGHRYKQGVRTCQPYTVQVTSKEQMTKVKSTACLTYKGQWVIAG